MKPTAIVIDAIIKPMEITIKDPAIAFVNVYTAIIYGIYYSFFAVGFLDPSDQKISRRC
jgi:MFS transporter, DHA1 family, multidrug resistance protein